MINGKNTVSCWYYEGKIHYTQNIFIEKRDNNFEIHLDYIIGFEDEKKEDFKSEIEIQMNSVSVVSFFNKKNCVWCFFFCQWLQYWQE